MKIVKYKGLVIIYKNNKIAAIGATTKIAKQNLLIKKYK